MPDKTQHIATVAQKNSKKQRDIKHKNATKTFDCTTIADRLRTVSWSNDNHQTGVVKPVYGIYQLNSKAM